MLFVLYTAPDASPWVLCLEAQTRADCEKSISWQVRGGTPRAAWSICRYDPAAAAFVDDDGTPYRPDRGPYTVEAWEAFKASLPRA